MRNEAELLEKKTEHIYVLRPNFGNHLGINMAWLREAWRQGTQIVPVTTLTLPAYFKQREGVRVIRSNGGKVFVAPRIATWLPVWLFLVIRFFKGKRLVLQFKKVSLSKFLWLRSVFGDRVSFILELEGDPRSEIDFLQRFSSQPVVSLATRNKSAKAVAKHESDLKMANGLCVVTQELGDLVERQYFTDRNKMPPMLVRPTGFSKKSFFYDPSLRRRVRSLLKIQNRFVVIFTGNVFYSWQNIDSTIDLFRKFQDVRRSQNPYLIILTRQADIPIAEGFVRKHSLTGDEYLLTHVNNDSVNGYLNAADVGVLLRDNHPMNKVSSPGKLGEYLASGLQVVTTKHIGTYSSEMERQRIGIVLEDFRDPNEVDIALREGFPAIPRATISEWAASQFSVESQIEHYVDFLRLFSER